MLKVRELSNNHKDAWINDLQFIKGFYWMIQYSQKQLVRVDPKTAEEKIYKIGFSGYETGKSLLGFYDDGYMLTTSLKSIVIFKIDLKLDIEKVKEMKFDSQPYSICVFGAKKGYIGVLETCFRFTLFKVKELRNGIHLEQVFKGDYRSEVNKELGAMDYAPLSARSIDFCPMGTHMIINGTYSNQQSPFFLICSFNKNYKKILSMRALKMKKSGGLFSTDFLKYIGDDLLINSNRNGSEDNKHFITFIGLIYNVFNRDFKEAYYNPSQDYGYAFYFNKIDGKLISIGKNGKVFSIDVE